MMWLLLFALAVPVESGIETTFKTGITCGDSALKATLSFSAPFGGTITAGPGGQECTVVGDKSAASQVYTISIDKACGLQYIKFFVNGTAQFKYEATVIVQYVNGKWQKADRKLTLVCDVDPDDSNFNNTWTVRDKIEEETVNSTLPVPTCDFAIASSGGNINSVSLKNTLTYKWWCAAEAGVNDNSYCLHVESCEAYPVNNPAMVMQLLESQSGISFTTTTSGCSVDSRLISSVDYTATLHGFSTGHAFHIGTDNQTVVVECDLVLHPRHAIGTWPEGDCNRGTCNPPKHRRKRAIGSPLDAHRLSVAARYTVRP